MSRRAVMVSRVVAVLAVLASPLLERAGSGAVWAVVGLGLLAGVPHGAADHRILSRAGALPLPLAGVGYATAALVAWLLVLATGVTGIVVVVALSIVHFGAGELEAWPGRRTAPRTTRLAVATAGTGALLLPLARGGARVDVVAASLDPRLAVLLAFGPVRIGLVVLWLVAVAAGLRHAVRTADRGLALDLALLGLLGTLAPPLVAFAVWFGGWHAVRHTSRLLAQGPGGTGPEGARWFLRAAALPTLGAVLVLLLLAVVRAASHDPAATTALALGLLLAVTVPHVLVVAWLDVLARRRNIAPTRG